MHVPGWSLALAVLAVSAAAAIAAAAPFSFVFLAVTFRLFSLAMGSFTLSFTLFTSLGRRASTLTIR